MNDALKKLLREDRFPGNVSVWNELKAYHSEGSIVGFVGAGASIPIVPCWSNMLEQLIEKAKGDGLLNNDEAAHYNSQISRDPLQVAEDLEDTYSKHVFRSKLVELFLKVGSKFTPCHTSIVNGNYKGVVTLNYDMCLEEAYTRVKSRQPNSCLGSEDYDIQGWRSGKIFEGEATPILHLHGTTKKPETIVMTSSDYHNFYFKNSGNEFIENLWRSERLLIIGFSFSDPFLTMFADKIARDLPSDCLHYAFISSNKSSGITRNLRKQFSRKYRVRPIFYDANENHNDLIKLLDFLNENSCLTNNISHNNANKHIGSSIIKKNDNKVKNFKSDLFTAPNGEQLYAEPKLREHPKSDCSNENSNAKETRVCDIIRDGSSYCILASQEMGATTLCNRLQEEFNESGSVAILRDTNDLPEYKAKLQKEFQSEVSKNNDKMVLILDNFDQDRHERTLRELLALNIFSRYIVVSKFNPLFGTNQIEGIDNLNHQFKKIYLWPIERGDIRDFTSIIFDSQDSVYVSSIVDKVYKDLITLRIPLTPINVIMYLRILQREGNFQPLNKIQIVQKYLTEMLTSPNDVYSSSFNVKNKFDVISTFTYRMYNENVSIFSDEDWDRFCHDYKANKLIEFNHRDLLIELLDSRVVLNSSHGYAFRYNAHFNFFLGYYVSGRQEKLKEFIQAEGYLNLIGTAEVIASQSADNNYLIQNINEKLLNVLNEFWEHYVPEDFNPFEKILWKRNKGDKEKEIEYATEQINKAPINPEEIDKLKTCLVTEKASDRQEIIYQKFKDIEKRLNALSIVLIEVLKNGDDIEGENKINAALTIFKSRLYVLQIALLISPVIASSKHTYYKGRLFINNTKFSPNDNLNTKIQHIIMNTLHMVANGTADRIGAEKLGEVYKAIIKNQDCDNFNLLLCFSCLLRAKPHKWEEEVEAIIRSFDIETWYLAVVRDLLMMELNNEINSGTNRASIKRLIAMVITKRELGKKNPNKKLVTRILRRLENNQVFDDQETSEKKEVKKSA